MRHPQELTAFFSPHPKRKFVCIKTFSYKESFICDANGE